MSGKKLKTEHVPAPRVVPREGRDAHGDIYGVEGTNKTSPEPPDGAEPSSELQGTKSTYIPKAPYIRG